MSKYLRLARLIELMTIIKYHPEWGPKKLAEYFEISEKRLYDDLNELNAGGIPIVYNGKGYSFLTLSALPRVQFSLDEAMALLIGCTALEDHKNEEYSASARSAMSKLFELLSEDSRKILLSLEGKIRMETKGRTETQLALKVINTAISNRKTIRFDYYTYSRNATSSREADPYGVIFRGNSWYMIGWCHTRLEIRTFRLNRFSNISLPGRTYAYPKNFSIKEYIENSWGVFQGEEVEVEVRFDKKLAPLIEEHQWQPVQNIVKHKNGDITFITKVNGTLEIRRWILSWGEGVQVIRPESLREEISHHGVAIAQANS
jgi:predicted DNA-binding transcriptional regulator YafY